MADKLSLARLKDVLTYDDCTGEFVWRINKGRSKASSTAGRTNDKGYVVIRVDQKFYKAHRLAWFYCMSAWPTNEIDHIDGDRSNNRIANLRDASRKINCQNRRSAGARSTVGLLGVRRAKGKFNCGIRVDGRYVHLGTFESAEAAHETYLRARRLHYEGNTL